MRPYKRSFWLVIPWINIPFNYDSSWSFLKRTIRSRARKSKMAAKITCRESRRLFRMKNLLSLQREVPDIFVNLRIKRAISASSSRLLPMVPIVIEQTVSLKFWNVLCPQAMTQIIHSSAVQPVLDVVFWYEVINVIATLALTSSDTLKWADLDIFVHQS